MTLDQAPEGARVEILAIPGDSIRPQLVRMGIVEGAEAVCLRKLPLGPVVLRRRHQEIAIGRRLARRIVVK